jgi:hypothetical protein
VRTVVRLLFRITIKSDRICRTIRSVEPADSTIDA